VNTSYSRHRARHDRRVTGTLNLAAAGIEGQVEGIGDDIIEGVADRLVRWSADLRV
jgi:hypothetical protein